MPTASQNRRSHARRKERQAQGIPGAAHLPDELAKVFSDNQTSDEQERMAEALIYGEGGCTWAILQARREQGQRIREDSPRPIDIREFVTSQDGRLIARSA